MATATIDLDALRRNLKLLRSRLSPGCEFLAAVKANAYGHGAVPVARELEREGVAWFGVATAEEALELREDGIAGRILLLAPAGERVDELLSSDVDLVVAGRYSLERVRSIASRGTPRVHLKIDTGMGRLGLPPGEALELARELDRDERVRLESVWTHLATADEPDHPLTGQQLEAFESFRETLSREGIEVPLLHTCNSAGLLALPKAHYGLVRAGIALYGYPPPGTSPDPAESSVDTQSGRAAGLGFTPVMTLSAPVVFAKRVPAGATISYGATWRAPRDTTIATVRLGYADGYPRLLSNRAWALLGGRRAPVVGMVCMDQLMLDAGDLDVVPGDDAVLFGGSGPGADELASLVGTISYEMVSSVAARVERVYTG